MRWLPYTKDDTCGTLHFVGRHIKLSDLCTISFISISLPLLLCWYPPARFQSLDLPFFAPPAFSSCGGSGLHIGFRGVGVVHFVLFFFCLGLWQGDKTCHLSGCEHVSPLMAVTHRVWCTLSPNKRCLSSQQPLLLYSPCQGDAGSVLLLCTA